MISTQCLCVTDAAQCSGRTISTILAMGATCAGYVMTLSWTLFGRSRTPTLGVWREGKHADNC
jgi:hypothetical protein